MNKIVKCSVVIDALVSEYRAALEECGLLIESEFKKNYEFVRDVNYNFKEDVVEYVVEDELEYNDRMPKVIKLHTKNLKGVV